MSLIRQMWLLLVAVVLLAFVGSVTVSVVSARSYLETQLRLKNSDNAQALALALSQQKGDAALMELVAAAQFDTGYYQRIRLTGADGRVLFNREASTAPSAAPAWFSRLIPIESSTGVAQLSDGWRALGQVEVVSHSTYVYGELWNASLRTATWMAVLGLLAGLLGTWALRRIERPLNATVEQAQALVDRRFITVNEPHVPELQRLTRAMNAMVARLRLVFDEQTVQVEELRRQAHCDPLTGVSHRRHFLAQLTAMLEREDGPGAGTLVLVRMPQLAELNNSLGHQQTDRALQTVAKALREAAAPQGGEVGRLNGSDFALCSGEPAASTDAAVALLVRLRAMLAPFGPQAAVVLAAVNWQRSLSAAALMASADAALARAESRGAFSMEAHAGPVPAGPVIGEDGWRQRIIAALNQRRAQLVSYPVQDRHGALIHLECPLRLQLDVGGEFVAAVQWLPMAMRTRLMPLVDEAAVALALDQIGVDGQPRGVNLAPASLLDSSFLPRLRAALTAAPGSALQRLWLEVGESAAVNHFALVRELCTQLRPLGVKLGLEHAGEHLAHIERLFELGLDYVKLDTSVTRGVAGDAALAEFVKGSAWMLHGLGLQVYAEGVSSEADAQALWACGLDGVTGPWVSQQGSASGAVI